MSQQGKAGIFFLGLIAITLVFYLVFSTKNETIRYAEDANIAPPKTNEENSLEKISRSEIEQNYKRDLKQALNNFESIINPLSSDPEQSLSSTSPQLEAVLESITDLKVGIMDMTVPGEMKTIHLSLVKQLSDEKEEIVNSNNFDKENLLAIISELKAEHAWLQ